MKHYPPIGEVEGKKEQVEAMFDAIAPRYDLLNRVLSMGIDRRWRRKAVAMLAAEQPERILDVATADLQDYIQNNKVQIGIVVARPMDPRETP